MKMDLDVDLVMVMALVRDMELVMGYDHGYVMALDLDTAIVLMMRDKYKNIKNKMEDLLMLKLTFNCLDDWGMPVYIDQNGKLWKDVTYGEETPDLYSVFNNDIDEETCLQIKKNYEFITKYKKNPNSFKYQMLNRLQLDCWYYLSNGNRNKENLWGKNEDEHITEMKKLWNALPENEKPEWLTMADIENFEREMII